METTPTVSTPAKQLPRDVFLYLLMVFVLATAAVNLGTILFQFINLYVPGEAGYNYLGSAQSAIRWSVSSLIVVFPVLYWVLRFLRRDREAQPEKNELKIRKWLIYLTLFVAGLIAIGDMVTLVYTFLQGDITLRFVLKVAVVLWLSGSIFYYFLNDLHGTSPQGRQVVKWLTVGVVIAALAGGFWVSGSPSSRRALANDERRVGDLQSIENQIVYFWQSKDRLPTTLAELPEGTIGGYVVPVDPKTGQAYEYTASGLSYELCATFEAESQPDQNTLYYPSYPAGVSNWQHGQGRQCFDGTIDPERLQPGIKMPPVQ